MTDEGDGSQVKAEARRTRTPLIVGVGGSTAAIDSVERFFAKLVLAPDQTVVLVLQHHEAVGDPELHEILQKQKRNVLSEARDGGEIEGGRIYLCPVNMITAIQGGRFAIRKAEQAPGERATIDSFLVSLAEERAEESIGVVLAGTGGAGTLGVADRKRHIRPPRRCQHARCDCRFRAGS
jgi:two-component system, chemotaxis family, CheB/CheR fusion protein